MSACYHYHGKTTPLHARRTNERFICKLTMVCCCGVSMVAVRSNRKVEFNPVLNIRQRAAAIRALVEAYNRAYPRAAGTQRRIA